LNDTFVNYNNPAMLYCDFNAYYAASELFYIRLARTCIYASRNKLLRNISSTP